MKTPKRLLKYYESTWKTNKAIFNTFMEDTDRYCIIEWEWAVSMVDAGRKGKDDGSLIWNGLGAQLHHSSHHRSGGQREARGWT